MASGRPGNGHILVFNAGSSSIKFAVFDRALHEVSAGIAADIGGESSLRFDGVETPVTLANHGEAISAILEILDCNGIGIETLSAAAHRVVHGGKKLTQPTLVTPEILREITACSPLAPLHNPHNLAAIDALSERVPGLAQYVSFDTGFHATNPPVATRYAIPRVEETKGIRRYGFHGLSYASLVERFETVTGEKLPARLLAMHLGNGASLCAIRNGQSVATTMGYSPLDGLTMGTRSGGIDANAVLRLVEDHGLDRTKQILNNESGLLGLSGGKSDMRRLMTDSSADASFAVEHFCYWSTRHAGSLIAAMGGVDALVFTGGIGENAIIVRAAIMGALGWAGLSFDPEANAKGMTRFHCESSAVAAYVVPAAEEQMIASEALSLMDESTQ